MNIHRGRPAKMVLENPLEAKKAALEKSKRGECLTLDETRYAIWDPATEKKPLSIMAIQKIETRALAKLKKALAKYNINSLDDLFEPKNLMTASTKMDDPTA